MKSNLTASQLHDIQSHIRLRLLPTMEQDSELLSVDVLKHSRFRSVIICKSDKRGFVVKMYDLFEEFYNSKRTNELFWKHGIPCPRILCTRVHLRSRPGLRRFLIAEEEICGLLLHKLEDRQEAIVKLGRIVGDIHSNARRAWGPVFAPPISPFRRTRGSYLNYCFKIARRRIEKLEKRGGLSSVEAQTIASMLERARAGVGPQRRHELVHRDLTSINVIIRRGEPFIIDLDTAWFGHFAQDLVMAELYLCRTAPEKRLFLEAYFGGKEAPGRDLYEEAKMFFGISHNLIQADKYLRRIQKTNGRDAASPIWQEDRFHFHREQLLSFMN